MSAIDWTELRDSHGVADRIPYLLEKTDHQGPDGPAAVRGLTDRLNHMGTPSPAAEVALPLLLERAMRHGAPYRKELLGLATDIAAGGEYLAFVVDPSGTDTRADPVDENLQAIQELTEHRSSSVRAYGAMLLTVASDASASQMLRGLLAKESRSVPRGLALLGLAVRGRRDGEVTELDTLQISKAAGQPGTLGVLGAIAGLVADPDATARHLDTLLQALHENKEVSGLPVSGGHLGVMAGRVLARLAAQNRDLTLLDRVFTGAENHRMLSEVGLAALGEVMPRSARVRRPSELSTVETWILDRLVKAPIAAIQQPVLLDAACQYGGIPPKDLARFLGISPPEPADREVEGAPIWFWVRQALDGAVAMPDAISALGAISPAELVEVALDLARAPYGLARRWPAPRGGWSDSQSPEDEARLIAVLVGWLVSAASEMQLAQMLDQLMMETNPPPRASVVGLGALLQKTGDLPPRYDWLLIPAMGEDDLVQALRPLLSQLPERRIESLFLTTDLEANCKHPGGPWNYLELAQTESVAQQIVDQMATWSDLSERPITQALTLLRSRPAREVLRRTLEEWPDHPRAEDFRQVLRT